MPESSISRQPTPCGRAGLLVVLALVAVVAACGRKLPPIQPGTYPPPPVRDLAFQLRGEEVVLTWSVPAGTEDKDTPVIGFKVMRSRQTEEEAQCATCPPPFRLIGDVRPSGQVTSGGMQFADRLEPGFRYQYKVRSYSAVNKESRDSNVVHLNR